MTVWRMRIACWMYNTHCFSTAKMVARKRLSVTLYVRCVFVRWPLQSTGKVFQHETFVLFALCYPWNQPRSTKQSKLSKTCAWCRDTLVKSAVECERLFCGMDDISISKRNLLLLTTLQPIISKENSRLPVQYFTLVRCWIGKRMCHAVIAASRSLLNDEKAGSRLPLECCCEAPLCLIQQQLKLALCIWKHWYWTLFNEF